MLDEPNVKMALVWLKVLELTQLKETPAFPDFYRGEVIHLERKINWAGKHELPSATTFRKSLEIRNKRLSGR